MPSTYTEVPCYACLWFLESARRTQPSPSGGGGGAGAGDSSKALSPVRRKSGDVPSISESQSPSRWSFNSVVRTSSGVEEVSLLNRFGELYRSHNYDQCAEMLAPDARWISLHGEIVEGREAIQAWMPAQARLGRRNREEQPWVRALEDVHKYSRELKITFPSKATHDVVQTAIIKDGLIASIEVVPKYPALRVAIEFAKLRQTKDDARALELMSDRVRWKTWDGIDMRGKEGVKKLMRDQQGREVNRESLTEFEAAQVNEVGGCFTRDLLIERVDGIKVKTKQRIYVMGELAETDPVELPSGERRACWGMVPKIMEVDVLASEEFRDGKWVKCDGNDM